MPKPTKPIFEIAAVLAALVASGCTPSDAPSPDAPAADKFVGSTGCRGCHEKFHQLWATSHHGFAMQPFSVELAAKLAPQNEDIAVGEHRYRAVIDGGDAFVRETGPDGEKRYPIVHLMGGKNVYYFLTPLDKGRLQVLPVAYDVKADRWYDTAASALRHFVDVPEEVVHWTDREYTFNTSCYGCHVSQLSTNYDLASDTYHTVWKEPGINCETCHGPGAEHVRLAESLDGAEMPDDLKLVRMGARTTAELNNAACGSCHAKLYPVSAAFAPGERFFDHFGLITLEHPDFHPDGRDLGENYTYTTWMMSPCVQSGKLDCTHCHTSSGRYRFREGDANAACLPCHADLVADSTAHSHHEADNTGNHCIACHMPMTRFARMDRSDHSMLPPTPAATMKFNSPNACNICHQEETAAWADEWTRKWYPSGFQGPVIARAELLAAARAEDWSRLPEMLAYVTGEDRDAVFANSLLRLLASCGDQRKWPAVLRAMDDPSPLVRAGAADALAGLHSPEAAEKLLAAVDDEYRLVRVAAARSLTGRTIETTTVERRAALARAVQELIDSMHSRPDDPNMHANLGNYYCNLGQVHRAIEECELSLRLMPNSVPTLVNASLAYNLAGRNDRAEDCLRRALKIAPDSAAAHFNLGLLLGEQRRLDEAERHLRAALRADPLLAPAAYNLAVALAEPNPAESIRWARKAAELQPAEPKYAFTLAFYLQKQGQTDEAVAVLEGLLERHPGYADAYTLLADILEQLEKIEQAQAVYRRAVESPAVSDGDKARFRRRLRPKP
ncbi:MAG: tetratricopeptide repeat protein [Pirellulales bacterium]|nr:tetratricopeptide repeat protein [Pirellulales bacterium]